MNANEVLKMLEPNWIVRSDYRDTILRALRLLAAAESNDGSTPETNVLSNEISRRTFAQEAIKAANVFDALDLSRRFEAERNALAARVRELEEERCCTCRDGALKQPYSTMPPLQTLPWGTEK